MDAVFKSSPMPFTESKTRQGSTPQVSGITGRVGVGLYDESQAESSVSFKGETSAFKTCYGCLLRSKKSFGDGGSTLKAGV